MKEAALWEERVTPKRERTELWTFFLSATERAAGSLEKNHSGILSACHVGDTGSIPGSGTSPGEGNGYPLQCSFLENPTDRGAWRATVHGVARVGRNLVTKPPPPQRSQRERMFQGGCRWQCHQPKSMLTCSPGDGCWTLTYGHLLSCVLIFLIYSRSPAPPVAPSMRPMAVETMAAWPKVFSSCPWPLQSCPLHCIHACSDSG